MVSILLDSNIFDLLFDKDMRQIRIDIKKELPPEQYGLFITKRVEIELKPINDKNPALYEFISSFQFKDIQYFGFGNANNRYQRNGGFGFGFAPDNINQMITKLKDEYNKLYPNRNKQDIRKSNDLYNEETDFDLALHSLLDYFVITCDSKQGKGKKQGYLNVAKGIGGKVIFLDEFAKTLKEGKYKFGDLRKLIENEVERINNVKI